jgi:hypothetical protein
VSSAIALLLPVPVVPSCPRRYVLLPALAVPRRWYVLMPSDKLGVDREESRSVGGARPPGFLAAGVEKPKLRASWRAGCPNNRRDGYALPEGDPTMHLLLIARAPTLQTLGDDAGGGAGRLPKPSRLGLGAPSSLSSQSPLTQTTYPEPTRPGINTHMSAITQRIGRILSPDVTDTAPIARRRQGQLPSSAASRHQPTLALHIADTLGGRRRRPFIASSSS